MQEEKRGEKELEGWAGWKGWGLSPRNKAGKVFFARLKKNGSDMCSFAC